MKSFYVGTIIFLFGFSSLYSQSPNAVTNFKISTDNSPSTFYQNSPKLFPDGSKRFLTTWKDFRNGEVSTYAQWYDSLGNKINQNFKIFYDDEITFNDDDSFLASKGWIGPYYWPTYNGYYLYGKIYYSDGESSKDFTVFDILDEFDVDPLGIDYNCIAKKDRFIYFIRVDGTIITKAFDLNGAPLYEKSLSEEIPFRASVIASAKDKNNNNLLCAFNARKNNIESDFTDSISIGIYANIFDSNDSLIIKNVLIKAFYPTDEFYYSQNYPPLKCISVNDSLWEIFWLEDNRYLSFVRINNKGELIDEISTISFPFESSTFLNNFSFSPIQYNKFLIFISSEGYPVSNLSLYYNTILNFNSEGKFISQLVKKESFFTSLHIRSNNIFQSSDSAFFAVSSDDKDVFTNNIASFSIFDIKKINDDLSGSNDILPSVMVIDKNNFFISWENEEKNLGIKIDINGNISDSQREFEGDKFFFLPNGYCYNFWIIKGFEGCVPFSHKGYTLYNRYWNVVEKDSLVIYGDDDNQPIKIIQLSDSAFIMYYKNREELILRLMNNGGEKIKETEYNFGYSNIELFKIDNNSFIVCWDGKIQYFNKDLEPSSQVIDLYFNFYLNNKTFLNIYNVTGQFPFNNITYGSIFSEDKDTLVSQFYIASNANELKLTLFPDNNFLVMWQYDNNLYARAFSNEGIPETDSFLIHSDLPCRQAGIQSFKKQPAVAVNGNKVFFVWSDARNEGRGYDIYGSIFDLSKIVEVKEDKQTDLPSQFVLYQNYPNPFNPTTKIKYQIPTTALSSPLLKGRKEVGLVTLKVYDILGNEVATLVDEVKPAGTYEVEFNGSKLSSGVYFYQLKVYQPGLAGNFIETKKFVLIK